MWSLAFAGLELCLEGNAGFAEIMEQRGKAGEQADGLGAVPVIFILAAQDVAAGYVGRYGPAFIELASVTDDPEQFAVILAAYPVAGDGGILPGALAQQAAQGVEPFPGDGGLPGALAPTFGKLVQDSACLDQRIFRALRDEQYVHGLPDFVLRAMLERIWLLIRPITYQINKPKNGSWNTEQPFVLSHVEA